jgi:amidohydrolase
MLEKVMNRLEALYPQMVSRRRYLHQHPELSFQEVQTAAFIADQLKRLGIHVRTEVGGRGVVGVIEGGLPGKTVALRADFDALPIQDEKDVPYRSTVPGVMHACGHDAHTSALLAVAEALMDIREQLKGRVVLIHQFAEELAPGGAKPMIEDGCLDGVDVIFGTHIWSTFPFGTIHARSGAIMAAADQFEIIIEGKGAHGAEPHRSVDAVVTGAQLVMNLQTIVSRRIDPLKQAVVTVGSFHAGKADNVIANEARIAGTVRTFEPEVQDRIIQGMETIANATCEGAGARCRFNYVKGYPAVINHQRETEWLMKQAENVVGEGNVYEMAPLMAAEDFAYYLQKVPGVFFFTGAGNPNVNAVFPHHHPRFDIDERAMLTAAKMLSRAAIQYLTDGISN